MIGCNFLLFSFLAIAANCSSLRNADEVDCPCPLGHNDTCVKQQYCVYGIDDQGNIYFNGEKDIMNLTNVVPQRRSKINSTDDVTVNLYNPASGVIFYYGCQECEDLKKIGHLTVSKLRIFLLSIYNQRMKHNIRYSQSDFNHYRFEENMSQPLPIIDVRPFWKNRLMLDRTCAGKSRKFTQKHFIPAFLTQDICAINYEYYLTNVPSLTPPKLYKAEREVIYSMTLSNNVLYQYQILPNSTAELPKKFQVEIAMCKFSFNVIYGKYSTRFFCLCEHRNCTLDVIEKDPQNHCPKGVSLNLATDVGHDVVSDISRYIAVDQFFMMNGCQDNCNYPHAKYRYCYLEWGVKKERFVADIVVSNISFHGDYEFYADNRASYYHRFGWKKLGYIGAGFYKQVSSDLRKLFLGIFIDHVKLNGDPNELVGANCREEMPLSLPMFSSAYGSNSSEFPCYKYFDIYNKRYVYPVMGLNMMPVSISKGKECYFYKMKVDNTFKGRSEYMFIKSLVVCPEGIDYDEEEVEKVKRMNTACPISIPGTNQFVYNFLDYENSTRLCGQFLRGIKLQNGRYVPDQVELKFVTYDDLKLFGLMDVRNNHGCGFDTSQKLTLCTCKAALGGCEKLYIAGRVHLLRYLPSP